VNDDQAHTSCCKAQQNMSGGRAITSCSIAIDLVNVCWVDCCWAKFAISKVNSDEQGKVV
jgi:hypothetical protein